MSKTRCLYRKHILRFYYLANRRSGCVLLISSNAKGTAWHVKHRILSLNQIGQHATTVAIVFAGVAEKVILLTVSMKIKTELYPIFPMIRLYFLLNFEDLRMKNSRRVLPTPVQIHACDVTSKIPINNPIYIYHRINLYDEIVQQILRLRGPLQKRSHHS